MLVDQRCIGREPAEVGARAEDLVAGAREDDGVHPLVHASSPDRVHQLGEKLRRQRIALLGPVELHGGHAIADVVEELLVGHPPPA